MKANQNQMSRRGLLNTLVCTAGSLAGIPVIVDAAVSSTTSNCGFRLSRDDGWCANHATNKWNSVAPRKRDWFAVAVKDWVRLADQKGWKTSYFKSDITSGCMIVFKGGDYGHVAWVDSYSRSTGSVTISEMNWGTPISGLGGKTVNFGCVTTWKTSIAKLDRSTGYTFRGFIFPVFK